jgi:MFS family permease
MAIESTAEISPRPIGYLELIRSNRNFRNLWTGQIVSELGDWLATVALLNLMLDLTGRAQVVSWFFIVIHLPSGIIGPFSGVIVDRFNRKKLMIATDLARSVLVLGYLLVRSEDQIWILYLTAALEVAMMTIFEPARTSTIPNICTPKQLIPANALASLTWSTMLALGGALGGLITALFGRHVCYVLDSLSFICSAAIISRVRLPAETAGRQKAAARGAIDGFREIADGFHYLTENLRILALALVKTGWCLGMGVVVLLSIFGEKVFPVMGSGAAGIGVLYGARGLGTALGPILARRFTGESRGRMRWAIAAGFFMASVFYVLFGRADNLPAACAALIMAHMGGSIAWVFSTVLLQLEVPDKLRGRVFSLEFALLIVAIAASNYVTGYALDVAQLSPREVAAWLGTYFLIPGTLWLIAQRLYRRTAGGR